MPCSGVLSERLTTGQMAKPVFFPSARPPERGVYHNANCPWWGGVALPSVQVHSGGQGMHLPPVARKLTFPRKKAASTWCRDSSTF